MGDIKFRAWHKKAKYIIPWGDLIKVLEGKQIGCVGKPLDERTREYYSYVGNLFAWLDIELMQYTGLKDKNGKEIYEGDIVKFEGDCCEVYFQKGSFAFEPHPMKYNLFHDLTDNQMNKLKVIGNIYETPELLN